MGYYSQNADYITGAVSIVTGEELAKSPASNLLQVLAGRLPGLFLMEADGEPGNESIDSYVRGISTINRQQPLIILDGMVCPLKRIDNITPDEIETVSILKDVSLTSIYGIRGANGVIVINTKKGQAGVTKVTASYDQSLRQMTRKPVFIHSYEYATLRNQAWRNDGGTGVAPYSQPELDGYASRTDRTLYPDNNFYDMMFKTYSLMERASLNATAGNDRIRMFSDVNLLHGGGQFITDQSTFKPGQIKYDSRAGENYLFNFRSNLDFKLHKVLDGFIRLSGNVTRENVGGQNNKMIYSGLFSLPPVMYGPYTPLYEDPQQPGKIFGGEVVTTSLVDNPAYGMLNRSGYLRYTETEMMAQAGLNFDLAFLAKGLTLEGRFAYQTNSAGNQITGQDYERWIRSDRTDELSFNQAGAGTWQNTPLAYGKSSVFSYCLSAGGQLTYQNRFGKHSVSGMGYGYYENQIPERSDGDYVFPYNRIYSGISVCYAYGDKYVLKGDAGYSGTDQYARSKRFVLTPSLSAAWIVSNENFMKDVDWLTQLKFRLSAGQTANDYSGERFIYTDKLINGGGRYIENLNYMITENYIGNPELAPEIITGWNYGIDAGIGNTSFSVDYFTTMTDNMLITTTGAIPSFTGLISGIYPPFNRGKMQNKGIEITAGYAGKLNNHISATVTTFFNYTSNTVTDVFETPKGADYAYTKRQEGYATGQPFGYLVDYSSGNGFFNSQEETESVYYSFGTPRPGDFRYKNLNGDKTEDGRDIIDEKDMAPTGNPVIPKINYGFSFSVNYKNLELSCLVYGTGLSSRQYQNAAGIDESLYGGMYSDIHKNAWTPERAASGEKITFPALSAQQSTSRQLNDFFTMNTAYIRIKNLEMAWLLPSPTLRLFHARQIRLVLNAHNLYTWDFLKTNCIDPEIPALNVFQNYRIWNAGIRITF
jgi:TonB-linked SusC/RagA family outer membrane protein